MCDNNNDYWDDDYFDKHSANGDFGNGKISLDGCMVLIIVVAVCVGICLLALSFGIEIPVAMIELFLDIIVVVAFLTLLVKFCS